MLREAKQLTEIQVKDLLSSKLAGQQCTCQWAGTTRETHPRLFGDGKNGNETCVSCKSSKRIQAQAQSAIETPQLIGGGLNDFSSFNPMPASVPRVKENFQMK